MNPRRQRSFRSAVTCALAVVLLGSCGFDYETDQISTLSAGVNDKAGRVDVLGAVVIAGEPDRGVFAASLSNNSNEAPAGFEGLRPTADLRELEEFAGTRVPVSGLVNLFARGGVPVEGDFRAGDFVTVSLEFAGGQVSTLEVPVVTPCYQYSLLVLTEIELPGTADEVVEPTEPVEGDTVPELGEGPGEYTCDVAQPVEHDD